jgi:hypothetical protein
MSKAPRVTTKKNNAVAVKTKNTERERYVNQVGIAFL